MKKQGQIVYVLKINTHDELNIRINILTAKFIRTTKDGRFYVDYNLQDNDENDLDCVDEVFATMKDLFVRLINLHVKALGIMQ